MKFKFAFIVTLAVMACAPASPTLALATKYGPVQTTTVQPAKPDATQKLVAAPSKACLNSVAVLKARSARLQGQLTERQNREAKRLKTWQGVVNDVKSKSPHTKTLDKSLEKFTADIVAYPSGISVKGKGKDAFLAEYTRQITESAGLASDVKLTCDKANRAYLQQKIKEARADKDSLSKLRANVAKDIAVVEASRKQLLKDRLACTKAKKCKKAKVFNSPTDSPAGNDSSITQ